MAAITVEKWNVEKDGPLNEANLSQKLEKQGYKYVKHTLPPGKDFPDHTLKVTKKNAILVGKCEFGMYGQTIILKPGDIVLVPQDTVHSAKVLGEEESIVFDCTK